MPKDKQLDPETGEIVPEEGRAYDTAEVALRTAPDFSKSKPIESIVGKRPPLFNLKDHPEFDGCAFTIVRVKEAYGEMGYHLYLAGWMSSNDKAGTNAQACIIRTGSEFVLGRIVPAMNVINGGQMLTGVLRTAGRAWMFD